MKFVQCLLAGILASTLVAPVFADSNVTPPANLPSATASAINTSNSESATANQAPAAASQSAAAAAQSQAANDAAQPQQHSGALKAKSSKSANNQPVNINTASVDDLKTLKGIGEKRAEAIINYRQTNGNFASIDDLSKVKGISQRVINENRDRITMG